MASDNRYNFDFRASTIGFNPLGLHVLRNRLITKTIAWDQVTEARILRGMDYNNWLLMLILGGAMALGGLALVFNSMQVAETLSFNWLLRGNFYALTVGGLGTLLIVLGIRRTMVIEFKTTDERWHRHSLREIAQKGNVPSLVVLIQNHLPLAARATFPEV
jgi:hypothetical protein